MSKADRMMADAIDRIDRVLDIAVFTVRVMSAGALLKIASKMVRWAAVIIEEEGAKV